MIPKVMLINNSVIISVKFHWANSESLSYCKWSRFPHCMTLQILSTLDWTQKKCKKGNTEPCPISPVLSFSFLMTLICSVLYLLCYMSSCTLLALSDSFPTCISLAICIIMLWRVEIQEETEVSESRFVFH